jgi:putative membrane protein
VAAVDGPGELWYDSPNIDERGERRYNVGRLLISWFINAVALAVAAYVVPMVIPEGIVIAGEPAWLSVAIAALIFGLVNALIRPLLKLVTCPLILLTLGLFTLIINGLMLWLTSWIGQQFDVGFVVSGFWSALLGALIISVVSFFLSLIFREDEPRRRGKRQDSRQDRW